MSEILDILNNAVDDRAPIFGDMVTNLRTGQKFMAEVVPVQDMELNEEMGRDPRESATMYVNDGPTVSAICMNDLVTVLGAKFKIVRRSDNPLSVQSEFGLMKITSKDA